MKKFKETDVIEVLQTLKDYCSEMTMCRVCPAFKEEGTKGWCEFSRPSSMFNDKDSLYLIASELVCHRERNEDE